MSGALLQAIGRRERFGLKGPRAPQWLTDHGLAVPAAPNSWLATELRAEERATAAPTAESWGDDELLIARLGVSEFFLEDRVAGTTLQRIVPVAEAHPPGVYPVLRQDASFALRGAGSDDVLAQVCNVNFPALDLDARPVIMTLMIGIAVLVLPREVDGQRLYRIWCDPTFARYLGETLERIVIECGGIYKGASE